MPGARDPLGLGGVGLLELARQDDRGGSGVAGQHDRGGHVDGDRRRPGVAVVVVGAEVFEANHDLARARVDLLVDHEAGLLLVAVARGGLSRQSGLGRDVPTAEVGVSDLVARLLAVAAVEVEENLPVLGVGIDQRLNPEANARALLEVDVVRVVGQEAVPAIRSDHDAGVQERGALGEHPGGLLHGHASVVEVLGQDALEAVGIGEGRSLGPAGQGVSQVGQLRRVHGSSGLRLPVLTGRVDVLGLPPSADLEGLELAAREPCDEVVISRPNRDHVREGQVTVPSRWVRVVVEGIAEGLVRAQAVSGGVHALEGVLRPADHAGPARDHVILVGDRDARVEVGRLVDAR